METHLEELHWLASVILELGHEAHDADDRTLAIAATGSQELTPGRAPRLSEADSMSSEGSGTPLVSPPRQRAARGSRLRRAGHPRARAQSQLRAQARGTGAEPAGSGSAPGGGIGVGFSAHLGFVELRTPATNRDHRPDDHRLRSPVLVVQPGPLLHPEQSSALSASPVLSTYWSSCRLLTGGSFVPATRVSLRIGRDEGGAVSGLRRMQRGAPSAGG